MMKTRGPVMEGLRREAAEAQKAHEEAKAHHERLSKKKVTVNAAVPYFTAVYDAHVATLTYNRDWPQSKRDKLDAKDFAGPNQSYPIATQADVDAAVRLMGKAPDPAALKARIKAIAKRKGLSIPDAWQEEAGGESARNQSYTEAPRSQGGRGMYGDPHGASKGAAGASLMAEHMDARGQAMGAMDASAAGNSKKASGLHTKAAELHEAAASKRTRKGFEPGSRSSFSRTTTTR